MSTFFSSFCGRLANDPVLRTSAASGNTFVTFTMAYNNRYRNRDEQLVTETTYYEVLVNSEDTGKAILANCKKGGFISLQSLRPPKTDIDQYQDANGDWVAKPKTSFIDPILDFPTVAAASSSRGPVATQGGGQLKVVSAATTQVAEAEIETAPAATQAARRTGRPASATRPAPAQAAVAQKVDF
jgi:single-stranded DNA-binding protein